MRRMLAKLIVSATIVAGASATFAQAPPKGDPAAGASLFADRCAMCHVAAGGGQGPSLTGAFGRKAASLAGFHYTAALVASGIVWSGSTLDRFLAGPGHAVPGTAMAATIHDPRQRADLIAYLASRRARP